MIILILLWSFSFGINGEDWRVYVVDDSSACYMGCVIPDYHFIYLDYRYLDCIDPWGNTLFEHELRHAYNPDWLHDGWLADKETCGQTP